MDVTIEGATGSLTVSNTLVSLGELDLQSPNFQFDDVDGASDGVHRSRSPGTQSEDSCHMEEPEEKGRLNVVVKRASFRRTNSAMDTGMPCYKMDSRPRGMVLIIEIEEYVNDVQERRIGSAIDAENLRNLFVQLQFKVEHKKNLKRHEFDRELETFAGDPGHREADMMILAILSHGREGNVFASDGTVIAIEAIYEKFNNRNCPALQGKPKFFIIQACRGDDTDQAHCDYDNESLAQAGPGKKRRHGHDAYPSSNFGEMNKARPTWEDMIIAYSTIPGYVSNRDHVSGTWFIQSLVEVFMNHAHDREIIDLLRMTSQRLSHFTNEYNEKQTCNVEMRHLYKRIYFNPGLPGTPKPLRRSKSTPPPSPRRRTRRQETLDDDDEES